MSLFPGAEDYMGERQYLEQFADYSGGMVIEALKMEDLTPAYEAIARELGSRASHTIGIGLDGGET